MKRKPIPYFISYARLNMRSVEGLLGRLHPHLQISAKYEFKPWRDTGLLPGEEWDAEIKKAAARCTMALLLVSPEFFSRSYIMTQEVPRLVRQGKVVIPVYLKRVNMGLVKSAGLDALQWFTLPDDNGGRTWAECRTTRQKDDFALVLHAAIEQRLGKSHP